MKSIFKPVTLISQSPRLIIEFAPSTHQIFLPFSLEFSTILEVKSAPTLTLAF